MMTLKYSIHLAKNAESAWKVSSLIFYELPLYKHCHHMGKGIVYRDQFMFTFLFILYWWKF